MHYDEILYQIALYKESEYLDILNHYHPNKTYSTLTEALNDLFKKREKKDWYNEIYVDGINPKQAEALLGEIEDSEEFRLFTKKQAEAFISNEIAQIRGLKTADNKKMRAAGYVDEVATAKNLSSSFKPYQLRDLNDNNSEKVEVFLKYQGRKTGDFVLTVDVGVYDSSGANWLSPKLIDGFSKNIPFENKLSLNKFHFVDGELKVGDSAIYDLEQEYIKIMQENDTKAFLQDTNYDILDDEYKGISDAEIYSRYYYKLDFDVFNQILANYLMLKKLEKDIPIFVSSSSGHGLDFKLCSDVIYEVGHGNFTLYSDLKRGDSFIAEDTGKIKFDLIKQAIKKVNNYNLWYGK